MVHAHLSSRIVTSDGVRPGALLVEQERFTAICTQAEIPLDATRTDHGTHVLLPGLVDAHVHLNEPGRGDWEGFRTGTCAAAAGGFTTVLDMPLNGLPETTTVEALERKRTAATGLCTVDWAAWGGCVADNQRHLPELARAGVHGFKCFLIYPGCDGFTMVNRAQLEAALPPIARSGLPLLAHAELSGPIEAAAPLLAEADWRQYFTFLASRPDAAEVEAIRMLLTLCAQYGVRLHIVHLASALALPLIATAKAAGQPVTVETCPHYLHFTAEAIPDGSTLHKCAPPIRSRANRELLWQALADRTIDLIATDHSPCPPAMKRLAEGRFDLAWGGIASLSVALSAVWTEASARGFTLEDLTRWMSTSPAQLAGLADHAGALAAGREASFTVFNPEADWTVAADDLHFRHSISPYVGERLRGRVQATYLRGCSVFERATDGTTSFAATPHGHEVRLS